MSFRLRAGEQSLVMGASHAPNDSLVDLIEGLTAMLAGSNSDHITVRWNCEPEEFDFVFVTEDGNVAFAVTRYPDHRRAPDAGREVFAHSDTKLNVCLPFWRELRGLQRRADTDVFAQNWRRPFPQREMQNFTKLIRAAKRQSAL